MDAPRQRRPRTSKRGMADGPLRASHIRFDKEQPREVAKRGGEAAATSKRSLHRTTPEVESGISADGLKPRVT